MIPWTRGRALALTGALGVVAAGVLLGACRGPQEAPPAGPRADADGAPATASAGQAASIPSAKPAAPMQLRFELLEAPRVGQPLGVRITVTPQSDVAALTLEARGTDALVLTPPSYEPPTDVRAGDSVSRDFTVVPVREGRHRLSVVARGLVDGEPQAAGLVVPVRVGEAPAVGAAPPESQAGRGGERLRSLPAEERNR
jgi:hypothetical protein